MLFTEFPRRKRSLTRTKSAKIAKAEEKTGRFWLRTRRRKIPRSTQTSTISVGKSLEVVAKVDLTRDFVTDRVAPCKEELDEAISTSKICYLIVRTLTKTSRKATLAIQGRGKL
jgi:hypothetical protein